MIKEIHLSKKDFRVEWFSGTGAGGQYRNKHQNCCRIFHIESGLMATGQSNRDRPSNQREAFKRLAEKILALNSNGPNPRRDDKQVVRTYHFERDTVTDGISEKCTNTVMNGDIDEFLMNGLKGIRPNRETGRV